MHFTKNPGHLGLMMVFLAGTLWGTIGAFVMEMEKCGSTSSLTSFLRIFFAFLILAAITAAKFGIKAFLIDRKTLFYCALLGIICHGIYNVFYSLAVTLTGVSVSAVLLNIAPVFTFLMAICLFSEKITAAKLTAILVNVAGCILTVTGGQFRVMEFSLFGILCGIGAGFCYSMTAVIGRFASGRANTFIVSTYSYLFASVFLFFSMQAQAVPPVNSRLVLIGFFYALIPTSIGYLLYYYGVQRIRETSKVPVFASMETVISAVIGIFIYREVLGMVNLLGILLVLASILLMNRRGQR